MRNDQHQVTITILFPDLEVVREAVGARARLDLAEMNKQWEWCPMNVLEPRNLEQIRRVDPKLANTFVAYGASTIAYRFDFDVTESNHNDGSLTFALPFNTGTFALDLGGKLNKDREGQRTFTMAETFQKLVYLNCDDWVQANRNIVYPATGSIGMGKIINAFIDVSQLGGGHDKFTDDITFTTTVRGKLNPTLELAPVLNRFQLAKATGEFESKRVDTHKLKVSLAFPDLSMVGVASAVSAAAIPRLADETKNRALINICIAEGESRENQFNTLREISPKEYCRRNDTSARRGERATRRTAFRTRRGSRQRWYCSPRDPRATNPGYIPPARASRRPQAPDLARRRWAI